MSTWLGQHYYHLMQSSYCPDNLTIVGTTLRGLKLYAPQTKILDGRTNVWERIFEVLFSRVSALYLGYIHLKLLRKYVPKCSFGLPKSSLGSINFVGFPGFQNLRLGSIKLLQKIVASQKTNMSCCYYLL
jgi:hypothetical protein